MSKLTPKQARFVEEYLVDLNATVSAERAGYKEPNKQGPRLLVNVGIQREVERALTRRSKRTEINQERVLKELARIAHFDPRRIFDEHGNFRDVKDLDDDVAACIAGVEVVRDTVKNDQGAVVTTETVKLKFWNKVSAVDLAMKHLGLLIDRKKIDVNMRSHEDALKELDGDGG